MIYNVEWLGWDIVEPLTYTTGQGLFVMGMILMMRKNQRLQSTSFEDIEKTYVEEYLEKQRISDGQVSYNIDRNTIRLLEGHINKIDEDIKFLEEKIIN